MCDFSSVHVSSIRLHECYQVESLQISRHLQYLRHLLSTARRTGFFPICSSPSAEEVHESLVRLGCLVETFPVSSSFVVQCMENGSLFSLQACQPVRRNPIPPMKYISPMIQVGYVFQQNLVLQCMDGNSDDGTEVCGTSLSASSSSVPSWTLNTCRRRHFFVILRRCCFNIFCAR